MQASGGQILDSLSAKSDEFSIQLNDILGAGISLQQLALPLVLILAALSYLTSPPGILSGIINDILDQRDKASFSSWVPEDLTNKVGRTLGKGTFGTAFEGFPSASGKRKLGSGNNDNDRVVLKRVADDRQADIEAYFNRRVRRLSTRALYASFLGNVKVDGTTSYQKASYLPARGDGRLLIWRYEGSRTLESYVEDKAFPLNLEATMVGAAVAARREKEWDRGRREADLVRRAAGDVLRALDGLHRAGIVHRDCKPANILVSEQASGPPLRLLDFGAAVDLANGFNYDPARGFLDPRYGPPERFVVPQETQVPAGRLAALFSAPGRWSGLRPDRFDSYCAGVTLLQMALPQLRAGSNLRQLNTQLGLVGGDLEAWRQRYASGYDTSILDGDGDAGWDLARKLVCARDKRVSAAEALRHRFLRL